MTILMPVRAAIWIWLCLPVLLIISQSRAEVLVDFTFGDSAGTATNLPQSVAANLSATPMVGKLTSSSSPPVVGHDFIVWSTGNMAMRLSPVVDGPNGGRQFEFTLQADPGFTFQLTEALFTWAASNTAGNSHGISMKPNLDPAVGVHNGSGGDFMETLGPAYPGWQMSEWNSLASRTDLTSLVVNVGISASNTSSYVTHLDRVQISGNVLPEPATTGLLFVAAAGLSRRRQR